MKRLLLLTALPLLAACDRNPVTYEKQDVDFATHVSVMRGTWRGMLGTQALSFTVTPTQTDATGYSVVGTGTLGTQSVSVSGKFETASFNYLRPQTSPLSPVWGKLTLTGTGVNSSLNCQLIDLGGGGKWRCGGEQSVTLTKG